MVKTYYMDIHKIEEILNDFDVKAESVWKNTTGSGMDRTTQNRIFSAIEKKTKGNSKNSAFLHFAAGFAIAACITAGFFFVSSLNSRKAPSMVTVSALCGQQSMVTLPDGSVAYINSDSYITYSTEYNKKDRTVFLSGEAYFEVSKNKDLPFIVDAHGILKVQALGTKFNVKAYPGEKEITATLKQGCIMATSGSSKVILNPGEEAKYSKTSNRLVAKLSPNPEHLIPWRDNELLLEKSSLLEISEILKRMYGVDVVFKNEKTKSICYTGLIRNNSLINVLELISGTSPVKYTFSNNTIEFK